MHTDIHPDNICIKETPDGKLEAKIIDLESAVAVGEGIAKSPIKDRDDIGPTEEDEKAASFAMDKAAVFAILSCIKQGSFTPVTSKMKEYYEKLKKSIYFLTINSENV